MHIRMRSLLGILIAVPALAGAQASASPPLASPPMAPPPDLVFLRAQRLVSEGRGSAGRALVDSVLATRAEGSPPYAEALFWRASLAATAVDAERDYRRLAVEFPLSPRSEDALLRLAQMELARGDRAMAVKHLERLALEHPTTSARPRASYWMARILFEDGDVAGGCTALAAARASVPASDVELRNEVNYLNRRCAGIVIARIDSSSPVAAPPVNASVITPVTAPVTAPVAVPPPPAVAASVPPPVTSAPSPPFSVFVPAPARTNAPGNTAAGARTDSTRARPPSDTVAAKIARPGAETRPVFVAATSVIPPANGSLTPPVVAPAGGTAPSANVSPPSSSPPAIVPAAAAPAATVPSAPAPAAATPPAAPPVILARPASDTASRKAAQAAAAPSRPAARTSGRFTVQVAAYDSRPPAEKLASTLVRGGWDARVFGNDRPFRVRIGRYTTRAEAVAAAKALAARKIEAFVTETEP